MWKERSNDTRTVSPVTSKPIDSHRSHSFLHPHPRPMPTHPHIHTSTHGTELGLIMYVVPVSPADHLRLSFDNLPTYLPIYPNNSVQSHHPSSISIIHCPLSEPHTKRTSLKDIFSSCKVTTIVLIVKERPSSSSSDIFPPTILLTYLRSSAHSSTHSHLLPLLDFEYPPSHTIVIFSLRNQGSVQYVID